MPSKAGKVPVTRFATGQMSSPSEANICIDVTNPGDTTTFRETGRAAGRVSVTMQMVGGHKMTPRYCSKVASAVLKTTFECAWIDHGEAILEPEFDHVREAVRGLPRDGFLLVGRDGDPDHNGTELTYGFTGAEGERGMWVIARYLGLSLATDSRLGEPVDVAALEPHAMVFRFRRSDGRAAA